MSKSMHWCVVGGGMSGCYAAAFLTSKGHKVTLLEGSSRLGGILAGPNWNGFALDNGCHLFDFADPESSEIFRATMDEQLVPVPVTYASIGDYGHEMGIAVPDLSSAQQADRVEMISELRAAAENKSRAARSLPDAVALRFGNRIAAELMPGFEKLCGQACAQLAPEAFDILSYAKRVRLGDDLQMASLKQESPTLDDRLAVKAKPRPKPRNFYPSEGGMAFFCTKLRMYLESIGVKVLTDTRIDRIRHEDGKVRLQAGDDIVADKLYWSLPASTLSSVLGGLPNTRTFFHPVSVDFFAFSLPADQITPITYLHDFRAKTAIFRSSSPGLYGNQFNEDGHSFVIAEVYDSLVTPTLAENTKSANLIFEQLKDVGQVARHAEFKNTHSWRLPTGLMLPKLGWKDAISPLASRLAENEYWLITNPLVPRGKRSIFTSIKALLWQHIS